MPLPERARSRSAGDARKPAGAESADGAALAGQPFQLALRKAPVVLFTHDADLRYTWVHDPEGRLSAPVSLGKTDLEQDDLYAVESADRIMQFKREVLQSGKGARRDLSVTMSGRLRVLDLSIEPIRDEDGRIIGVSGAAIDVTERRESKEPIAGLNAELQQRIHELQTIHDIAPVGINVAQDPECTTITSNRALAEMLGMPYGENVSKSRPDAEKVTYRVFKEGQEVPVDQLPMQRAASHGAETNGDILTIERGDGSAIDVLVCAKPVRDNQGRIQGAVGICIDVTAHRKAEEALREANRQKDEFLAILAHELRNPLAPIRGAVQLLRLLGSSVPDKGLAIEVIDRQVDTLARLVDDLLDVSRFTRGKIAVRKELLEISSAIQRAIDTTLPLIHARGQTLSVSLSNEPLYVEGDTTRIEQVFCNLLNNAAKFMDTGGRIEVSCRRVVGQAAIHIRDHGRGLATETIPRLFEPFYQVEQGLARSEGGLGLGLALARQLVELHGGGIEAHSEGLGLGTEFVVRLPLAQPATSSRSLLEVRASSTAANGGLRILIVDDSPDAVTTMKLLLEVRGHETRTASNGPEALSIFPEFRPQVILLDIGLPGMDGYEIAKRVRKTEPGEHTKIIATTGYGRDEDRLRATEAGFDYHLTKPVNFKTLEELLNGIRG
jgi:PAS domain S-box-containing protein